MPASNNIASSKAKLVPQPQLALAPGFSTFNCLLNPDVSKSIILPYKYFKLTESITDGGLSENCISSFLGCVSTSKA